MKRVKILLICASLLGGAAVWFGYLTPYHTEDLTQYDLNVPGLQAKNQPEISTDNHKLYTKWQGNQKIKNSSNVFAKTIGTEYTSIKDNIKNFDTKSLSDTNISINANTLHEMNIIVAEDYETFNNTALKGKQVSPKIPPNGILGKLTQRFGSLKPRGVFDGYGDYIAKTKPKGKSCNNLARPPQNKILKQNSQWQKLASSKPIILLHTAYLDRRETFKDNPSIRITAVISGDVLKTQVYCLLWYKQKSTPVSVAAYSMLRLSLFRKHVVNSIQYSMYLFTCAIPNGQRPPEQISVVRSACGLPTNLLTVVTPYDDLTKFDFGVCVVGQWGVMDDTETDFLIEWFESYRMLGVGEINLYNISIKASPLVQKVLDYYQNQGYLRLIHQTPPIAYTEAGQEYDATQLCLRTSANDCLYRNYLRYKNIFMVDRDEIIIPRQHIDYKNMVKYMHQHLDGFDKAPAIAIQNSYFFRDFSADKHEPEHLTTLRHRVRTPPSPRSDVISKPIINPQSCRIVWNHGCLSPVDALQPSIAPINIALLHHYRKGCLTASRKADIRTRKRKCKSILRTTVKDNQMLKFKKLLLENIRLAVSNIGLNTENKVEREKSKNSSLKVKSENVQLAVNNIRVNTEKKVKRERLGLPDTPSLKIKGL